MFFSYWDIGSFFNGRTLVPKFSCRINSLYFIISLFRLQSHFFLNWRRKLYLINILLFLLIFLRFPLILCPERVGILLFGEKCSFAADYSIFTTATNPETITSFFLNTSYVPSNCWHENENHSDIKHRYAAACKLAKTFESQ